MEDLKKPNNDSQSQDLREIIGQYLQYWPWFIISVLLTMGIAFLYLRYTTPVYQTKATILIKDERNSALSEMAAFQDLGLAGALSPSGFENEVIVLQSKNLIERAVKNLQLNVRYFYEGNVQQNELYKNSPINVTLLTPPDSLNYKTDPIYILPVSEYKFKVWSENEADKKEYTFGEEVSLPVGNIMVTPNFGPEVNKEQFFTIPVKVTVTSIDATVAYFRNSIKMEQLAEMSSVIQLTLNATNTDKSEAVLNELIKQYNQDAINDRNMVAKNTAEFINERLVIISEELDSVETGKVEFKQSNRLTDIAMEGEIFLKSVSEYNRRFLEIETQIELVRTMIDYVKNGEEFQLLPSNLGIQKEDAAAAIQTYNEAILARSRLLRSSTEKNPAVLELNEQIRDLKAAVLDGLNNAKISLEIAKEDLNVQESKIDTKLSTIPKKEKVFRGIMRQQEIKETLYLYLLQKREENAISMAVTTPKAKVVDYGYSSLTPISPRRNIVRLAALIIGFLIPFLVIYSIYLLDNKIRDKAFIHKNISDASVVGEIPKIEKRELIQENDRSVFAEAFRILRTNLQYLFAANSIDKEKGKTIFVTSSIKGEGKTLVSVNLALTLANAGSKVALVGADVRNPQLHRYMKGAPFKNGVVEYLINEDSTIEEYLFDSNLHENLTVMFSGTIPPNPAELWLHDRAKTLFSGLKERFDYVIVDTAPAMLVTDTFLINEYADATLFVIRAGFTEKKLIQFAADSIKDDKLKNVGFVLNNVSHERLGYGSKYGYYYTDDPRTKWDKIRKYIGLPDL